MEPAKERRGIRSWEEALASVINISTKFVNNNGKSRLKRSKTYAEVLQSGQA